MPEMTGVTEIRRKKYFEGMKIPHTYVIISCIVLLAFIATYLVPAGVYQRVLDPASGRNVIDPTTFQYVENTPVMFFSMTQPNLFTAFVKGLK
ncbi:MAG: C4-dicarboxylate ABC transporter permease, partial [Fusobacterium varium]|nr:C4-dicarboxylate ABC transporter permease [Fusobacterium varium]